MAGTSYEVREPVPDWLDQWNFIKYAAMNMCDRPAVFYFETALPVAGAIALDLLQFDWYSFVKRLIRPKQLRSQRHGRRGRRGGRRLPGIPEVSDIVAHHVDKTRRYRLPPTFNRTAFLFVIDDTIEQANNLAFLIEEGTKLPYQTFLGVIKVDPSKCPQQGAYFRTGFNWGVCAIEGPWNGMTLGTLRYARNTNDGFPTSWGPGVGSWTVVLQLDVRSAAPNTAGFQMRIFDLNNNQSVAEVTGVTTTEDEWTTLCISGTLPAGGFASWQVGSQHSCAEIKDMRFFAVRTG